MKQFFSTLLIALCFISCGKEDLATRDKVVVTFHTTDTKSGAVQSEEIQSLDLLIFRKKDGSLESHVRTTEKTVSTEVTAGLEYNYSVIVNAPSGVFDAVSTLSGFDGLAWSFSDISNYPVMSGCGEGFLDNTGVINVNVERLFSKVTLEGVTPVFLENSFKSAVVRLERVFLININGSCLYNGTSQSGITWYNKLCLESLSSSLKGSFVREIGLVISGPEKISDVMSFYCCPNPVSNDITSLTQPTWSIRNTRLVIELSIDGVANYYPINMPAMACNMNYVIKNAVLIGPGSASPDMPVNRTQMSFVITVNPWTKDNGQSLNF